ncbi:PAS domain-containing protein [Actinotalea sp. BY-33]|uniref:PAS domain-containing protein n=1 Tax=Actinotalea soli TaxID=2819234 RepID=A0A939LUS0_9CELL|nr:PAS domain-containing protein [Actinotalea soli]
MTAAPERACQASGGVRPTGVERRLGAEELIVTKTDLQGRITYANDTFLRISALVEEETLGRPHNIIRHPQMPRGLYSCLWSTIAAGEEMFAYVKNLATDGAHYWVLAHVTPSITPDGKPCGYHSNRRSPSRSALPVVEQLYARMLRAERGLPANEAARAGVQVLEEALAEAGTTYSGWIWSLEEEGAS